MSCIPNTPIASDVRDDGWQSFSSILTTTAAQWKPISAEVLAFDSMLEAENQSGIIRQLVYEETAGASGDIKKNDIMFYIYHVAAPTTPTSGTVYNPSTGNLLGQVEVTTADYERTSDTVWTARVNPNLYITSDTGNLATTFYVVGLFSNATPSSYTASAAGRVRMWCEANAIV